MVGSLLIISGSHWDDLVRRGRPIGDGREAFMEAMMLMIYST